MLPCSLVDAAAAGERVRVAFEAAASVVAGCPVAATVSVGAASNDQSLDIPALLKAADRALYRAKANGRNRVESSGPIIHEFGRVMIRSNATSMTFASAIAVRSARVHSAPPLSNAKPPMKGDTAIAMSSGIARRPISTG